MFILHSSYFPTSERPLINTVWECFFPKKQRSTGAKKRHFITGEVRSDKKVYECFKNEFPGICLWRRSRGCDNSDWTIRAIVYCCDKWKYQGENRRELELRGRNYRHDIRENFVINQVKIGETGASVPRGVQA